MTRRRLPGPTIPTVPSSKDVFVVSLKVTDEPLLAIPTIVVLKTVVQRTFRGLKDYRVI